MTPEDIQMIRQILPETMPFHHYRDRQSPWLLAQAMPEDMPVRVLRQGPQARLLGRPLVQPVAAGSGGVLRQRDLVAVAHAERAMRMDGLSAGARAALEIVYSEAWRDYELSFTAWGTEDRDWTWQQISRKGGNLVMQLGFPTEHAAILGKHFRKPMRKWFECWDHPVRQEGRPTLAWVRLDVDLPTGTALIEEVQSDWLREVTWQADHMRRHDPKSRQLKAFESYEGGLRTAYAKGWAEAALLAALMLLVDEFGVREIWMHQPGPGAKLKGIWGTHPPRSLYTSLPKSFGFVPVTEAPHFLERPARRALKQLRQTGDALFWKLDLWA